MISSRPLALCLVLALFACDKKPATTAAKPVDAQPAPSSSPACAARAKALEPWLAKLEIERASYEIEMTWKAAVIDREPSPVPQQVDVVVITASAIAGYDAREPNHIGGAPGEHATAAAIAARLGEMRDAKTNDGAADELLRLDVDQGAAWGDVVRVLRAAADAGYTQAVFAFTATPTIEAPPGVEPKTTSAATTTAASEQLDALGKACAPLRAVPLRHVRSPDRRADAVALAAETAAAIAACDCAADPDVFRKAAWQEARWHQAIPRVGVRVQLAGATASPLARPAATPWSDAAAELAARAPEGSAPLVAFVAR